MKKTIKFSLIALAFMVVTSCEEGFDDLNKSKTGATSLDPAFILNNAVISSSAPAGTLQYDLGIVQQIISSNSGVITGANFNQVNIGNTPAIWINYYQNVVKYVSDVIDRTKDDPARANLYHMARIIRAHAFMVLSDTYGDVPYAEGGGGYTEQVFFPKYDKQQDIYNNIIQELTEASNGLDAGVRIETADVMYSGNVAKWKKLGFSLLLRAGMRLVAADAAKAQSTVAAAAAGGVIESNVDNAVNRHDANYANGVGNTLNSTEAANYYLAEPFVDALQANNDPRLKAIAIRYVGATSGPEQVAAIGSTDPANQYGMPMGSDDAAAQAAAVSAGLGSRYAFSQLDRGRMGSRLAPMFLVTAAQCNFLLAEARFRGWITTSTAAAYFDAGIKAHMDQLLAYGASSAVAAADRDTYAAARAAVFTGNELQEINYEYWVASFLNGMEAWANFRRSGFPALTPNPYPGRAVDFITRLTYPPSETLVNSANVQAAIQSIGGDALDTEVWWDK